MSKTPSKLRNWIRKFSRITLFTLLFLVITANLFIILSGRFYLYKGIASTYLKGKSGPGIYDKDVFVYSTIKHSDDVFKWKKSKRHFSLTPDETKYMENLETSSFLVFQGDSLIFEKYWGEHQKETVSNCFSAAKTFVSLLVGIAIDEGDIKSLDEPVGTYIPEFKEGAKNKITVRHLLLMSSGLDWGESGKNPLSDNAESYYGTDLYGLVTSQKVIEKPGVRFNYQSGNSQLLAFIIEKATGADLSDYAYNKIWSKIGTEHDAYWSLDKENGAEKAFCCLYGTSRDFGRLGKLILQEGKWNGKQLVPLWYMKEMVKTPAMKTKERIPNYRYGLHIWTFTGGATPVYYCRGILGQYILSIPSKNLVIVRTGSKRTLDFVLPEKMKNDPVYLKKYERILGHPTDIMKYIAIGKRMIK